MGLAEGTLLSVLGVGGSARLAETRVFKHVGLWALIRGGKDVVEEHLRIIQIDRRVEALIRCLIWRENLLLLLDKDIVVVLGALL